MGIFEEVYVSELGFIMVKIYYPKEKRYVKYIVSKVSDIHENIIIPNDKINIKK